MRYLRPEVFSRILIRAAQQLPSEIAGALRAIRRRRQRSGRELVCADELALAEAIGSAFRREERALGEVEAVARRILIGW